MAWFVLVADAAEVLGAFDLSMPFFIAIAAGDGGVVDTVAVTEDLFGGSTNGSGDI